MANNRMYLKNTRTGAMVMLAKFYPSTGWFVPSSDLSDILTDEFDKADFGHLTTEQRAENDRHKGFGVPHPAFNAIGNEWVLELEDDGGESTK